ncbi:MAG: hypothetical protein ACRCWI_06095 [Brevinema sp.]
MEFAFEFIGDNPPPELLPAVETLKSDRIVKDEYAGHLLVDVMIVHAILHEKNKQREYKK